MYRKQIRKELEEYILFLKENSDKKNYSQIYENIDSAINRVLEDPTLMKYIKKGIGEFRAIDVLQQTRLFFRYTFEQEVVEFVWVNDEDTPHISEKKERDPCYKKFKEKLSNGDFGELLIRELPEPHIEIKGKLRKDSSIYTRVQTANNSCFAQLLLLKMDSNTYEIRDVYEDPDYSESLPILVGAVSNEAEKESINLLYFPESSFINQPENFQKILINNGFEQFNDSGETTFRRSA